VPDPASPQPLLVVVTGPPASGKTTIAEAIAQELALPLVAKDDVKEILFDTLGTGDRPWSRRLGTATFEILFHLARRLLESGQSLVLEGNFDAGRAGGSFATLRAARLIQVHCSASEEIVLGRYRARTRHPGHLDDEIEHEVAQALRLGRHAPLDLPGELLRVDTSRSVDAQGVARQVRALAEP
jgi:predicted kinase